MRKLNPSAMSLAVLACLFALVSTAAADAVYKWKDANGQSHYSQSPPPSGTKYETISPTGVGAAASSTYESAVQAPASGSTAFKPVEQSDNTAARLAYRQKNCETARANLALLNASPTSGAIIKPAASGSGYNAGGPAANAVQPHAASVAHASQQVDQFCGK